MEEQTSHFGIQRIRQTNRKTETVILEICNANFLSHLICIYFKSRGTMRLGLFWLGFMDAHNGVCLRIAFVCSAKLNLKFHATIESTTSALLCCRKTLSLFTTIGNRQSTRLDFQAKTNHQFSSNKSESSLRACLFSLVTRKGKNK